MTVYALPPEPEGPLWDRDGEVWVRNEEGRYETGGWNGSLRWHDLLHAWSPLSDEPLLGEVRWDYSNPRLFVVRAFDRHGFNCWRGVYGSVLTDETVERYYTRTEPAPAEEGDR